MTADILARGGGISICDLGEKKLGGARAGCNRGKYVRADSWRRPGTVRDRDLRQRACLSRC